MDHFGRLDIALCLQERHQAWLIPRTGIHNCMRAIGQDARNVFKQAATGNMRQRIDQPFAYKRQQAGDIDSRRFDQGIDQQAICIKGGRTVELPTLVFGKAAHQRISV